ncbi:hypothetical protein GCM10022215_28130 [Nocardioides fonticola]|uniref:Uncharacterized protein n=1 Tax=Nocardioides fonticola TaxID=450363 RepID=A0ABP7XNR7_9ACTN
MDDAPAADPVPPRRPRRRVFMTAGLTASAAVIALQIGADQAAARDQATASPRPDVAAGAAWAATEDDREPDAPES